MDDAPSYSFVERQHRPNTCGGCLDFWRGRCLHPMVYLNHVDNVFLTEHSRRKCGFYTQNAEPEAVDVIHWSRTVRNLGQNDYAVVLVEFVYGCLDDHRIVVW